MRSAMEVVVPDGEPRIPDSLWARPTWVIELGPYGRAAYEWKRAHVPLSLDLLVDPISTFRLIDQTTADEVRRTVQTWMTADGETEIVNRMPAEFAEPERDQVLAATRAAEIQPCLELVYLPQPTAPGDLIEDSRPTSHQMDLLATTTWETRPAIEDLRRAAQNLAELINIHGLNPDPIQADTPNLLTDPAALFPTELRIATAQLANQLGTTVDLYELFN